MKRFLSILLPAVFLTGCVGSRPAPPTDAGVPPPDMQAWLSPERQRPDGMSETRWQMLTDAGKTLGFRGGKAQRAWELIQALNTRETTLNALYDFRPLISPEGWLRGVRRAWTCFTSRSQIRTASEILDHHSPGALRRQSTGLAQPGCFADCPQPRRRVRKDWLAQKTAPSGFGKKR
nr:type IV secretory system conjugative DNA transfer family protein [Leclercia adecarboxylata]